MKIPEILSSLRQLKVGIFEEDVKNDIVGKLHYASNIFTVKLHKDSVAEHICIEYPIDDVKDMDDVVDSINERVISGRYAKNGNGIVLQSYFPCLDATFFEQQTFYAIHVLQNMIHICKH